MLCVSVSARVRVRVCVLAQATTTKVIILRVSHLQCNGGKHY